MGMEFSPETFSVSTHDNVGVRYVTAGIGSRSLAMLLDGTLAGLLALVTFMVVAAATGVGSTDGSVSGMIGSSMAARIAEVSAIGGFLLYFFVCEIVSRGRTPGKAAVGIRVIQSDGTALRLGGAALRNLLRLIDMGLLVGVLVMFASPRAQRLGDYAAGTVVVRERRTVNRMARQVQPPVYLRSSDPGRPILGLEHLGPREHGVLRTLLQRPDLAPAQRHRVAGELATRLCDRLQLPPDAPERGEDPEHLVERLFVQLEAQR